MPPSKRPHVVEDDDDIDDALRTEYQNSQIASSRKRPRVYDQSDEDEDEAADPGHDDLANPNHLDKIDENDDDDDDNSFENELRERVNTPPRTQYEIMRDADWQHLQHEELDDRVATQKVLSRPVRTGTNSAADNGIIESVTCVHFMCHERLHVELGPLINFVVGENGSGKSAVLTAITLCLGAKASSTNRGGSLKSFVKEGKDQSIIQVKLKNRGDGAYQHEIYGDSIIVERHFNKTGTSGFKLKSGSSGRIISSKRQAIDEIVEYFCLQVDNPLNVLSQDNARQFLNSASPALKYKYFVQGVQLESLDHDYKLIEEILESTEAKLKSYDGNLERLKHEAEEAHRLAKIVRENDQLRAKMQLLRTQLIWAQVVRAENDAAEAQANVDRQRTIVAKQETRLHATRTAIDEIMNKQLEFKEMLGQATNEYTCLEQEASGVEQAYQDIKNDVLQLHQEERIARERFQDAKAEIATLAVKVKAEEERLDAASGDARAKKQQELDQAKKTLEDNRQKNDELRSLMPGLQQQLEEASTAVRNIQKPIRDKQIQISDVEAEISQLRRSDNNYLDALPPNMAKLLDLIKQERGWTSPPIGPIGRLMALKKPKWSTIIEKFLGATPQGFIVKTKKDMDILQRLQQMVNVRNSPIIKISMPTLDLEGKEPPAQFDTILRVLDIDEPIVRDALIINHSIEQTLLIPRRAEAESVMFQSKPQNAAACICFHDHPGKRGSGLMLTTRGSNLSTSPIDRFNGGSRMRADTEAQIAHRQAHCRDLRNDLQELNGQLSIARQTQSQCQNEIEKNKARLEQIKNDDRHLRDHITDVEAELDAFEGGDNRLRALKEALAEAEQREHHNGTQFGELSVRKREENAKLQTIKGEVREQREKLDLARNRINEIKASISRYEDSLRLAQSDKVAAEENFHVAQELLEELLERLKEEQNQVISIEASAQQTCPGRVAIDPGDTYESLSVKYRTLLEQVQTLQQRLGGSAEEICEREAQALDAWNKAKASIAELEAMQTLMRTSLTDRIERWRYFQRHLSARTRVNFQYLLTERGFRGKMVIDHRAKVLALQVEPDEHRRNAKGRATNTLSGGEKSFSSVCMLLSIWEAMGSSIRCLDEFDVFMDNINRAISTNMLITAARRSVSRQYILITPNAIEGRAELDKDVKIIRLTDPRQRQITDMI
ncbi:hypothetical protein TD95_002504 [Thielaviopsis punctulata]|uniref:RecF/RecN/SMC N-terminal domain-containing protein n=1 Tax=Thielaviopsis punctulata TaxID=72032 RepID=A0A0F4ZHE2_9PEZI|nr:hypothetical protein TD95_002504 [Thielaviopsis punctulata]